MDLKAAVLAPTTFATLLAVTTATALALLAVTLLPTSATETTTVATLAALLLSPTPTSATAAATTLTATALLLPATSEALRLPPPTVAPETEVDPTTTTIITTTPPLDQTTLPTPSPVPQHPTVLLLPLTCVHTVRDLPVLLENTHRWIDTTIDLLRSVHPFRRLIMTAGDLFLRSEDRVWMIGTIPGAGEEGIGILGMMIVGMAVEEGEEEDMVAEEEEVGGLRTGTF